MKLYWCPNSRAVRALWMLEELGQPYEPVLIDIRDPSAPRDADFAKASPMGKVPALSDGDTHVSDGAAICLYLADTYPDAKLAPAIGDADRAAYLYWMVFTPGVIEPAMAEKLSNMPSNKMQHGWGDFPTMITVLEDAVRDNEWLLEDKFTAADVMVGSSANFMKMFGALGENKTIEAYIDRCLARPAYQRALAMQ